ncbi:MAG: exodeoxyribonuclease I [Pseudomonadales bacterium]|nr:exodeoxyribonuclease I [Pseudomonadales bacterium]
MNESIFWYDFETTGIDPARDRVIQFAGIRTDEALNICSEPQNLFCLPGDDVLPNPEAILVTGIGFDALRQTGINEAALSQQIHATFSVPGTCVAGYNSIRFDDEFSRQLFYRNFFDPYAREWQAGNSRWDVIDFFRMAHALRPEGFEWSHDEDGVVSFRLEKLTAVNGIGHSQAHDAVADVIATIDVTRKLRKAQPRLYNYLFDLRRKQAVIRQLYPLGKTPVVHVSSMFSARQSCVAVVLPLCVHPTNSNGVICYDLSVDPQSLIDLTPQALHQQIFTSNEVLEQQNKPRIALKTVHINRCPAVAPLSTLKGQEDRLGIDVSKCLANQKRLQQSAGIVEKLAEVFSIGDFEQTDDPDLMLYQGDFFTSADRGVMNEIQTVAVDKLAGFSGRFEDARLPEMLFRYRARNHLASLRPAELKRWRDYKQACYQTNRQLEEKLACIDQLRVAGKGASCLDQLEEYLLYLQQSLA